MRLKNLPTCRTACPLKTGALLHGIPIAGKLSVRETASLQRAFRCLQPANRRPKWERRQEGEWRFRRNVSAAVAGCGAGFLPFPSLNGSFGGVKAPERTARGPDVSSIPHLAATPPPPLP